MASGGKRKVKESCANGWDWDDTALIAAYDRAMNQVKDKAGKRHVDSGSSKGDALKEHKDRKLKWKAGDFCQAIFKEDNAYYEAQIISVNEEEDLCTVSFIGYENEEEVELCVLAPSQGKSVRRKQKCDSKKSSYQNESVNDDSSLCSERSRNSSQSDRNRNGKTNSHKNRHHSPPTPQDPSGFFPGKFPAPPFCPPFPSGAGPALGHMPPPPMPFFPSMEVTNENSLASMLMSWYMAGYHTGVHQGIQLGQRNTHHSSSMCTRNCCH